MKKTVRTERSIELKLVFATNNQNKVREFREILSPLGWDIISQKEAGIDIEAEETGSTLEENAAIKARAVYERLHIPVISDDSGLEVDALGGAPGVYSARYAEKGKRRARILSELENVPDEKRTARFKCCICFIDKSGSEHIVTGVCEGKIGYENRGENGFGYDPIFMYGDKSFAELTAEEKNAVSHRANAIGLLKEMLESPQMREK